MASIEGIKQQSNNWEWTRFDSYELNFQWSITYLREKIIASDKIVSSQLKDPRSEDEHWEISIKMLRNYHQNFSLYACLDHKDTVKHDTRRWARLKFIIQDSDNKVIVDKCDSFKQLHYGTPIGDNKHRITELKEESTHTLFCEIKVYFLEDPINEQVSSLGKYVNIPNHITMQEAHEKELCTDIILVSNDKEFKVHKLIMKLNSPFFEARFKEHWEREDSRVDMSDLESDILEALISFMYTGKVENICDIATRLWPAADKYGVDGLKMACEKVIIQGITPQNVIETMLLANTFNSSELKEACMKYWVRNPSDIQKTEEWKTLKQEHVELRTEMLEKLAESLIR